MEEDIHKVIEVELTQDSSEIDETDKVYSSDKPVNSIPWQDPTPEMLETPEFKSVWNCIKTWDINVPEVDGNLYSGATGNHVRAILDALDMFKVKWGEDMSKNVLKIITTIALIIGLVAGIFAIDSRYASVSALEQIEQQTVQSLESFRKSLDARYLYTRYNELIDQKMRLKIMQVSRPDDAEIKELLNQVNNNIKNTKTGIDKLNNE